MQKVINNNNDIEELLNYVQIQLEQYCFGKRNIVYATKFAVEEIILFYKENNDTFKVSVDVINDIKKLEVCIVVPNSNLNIENKLCENQAEILNGIIKKYNFRIKYSYKNQNSYIMLIVNEYFSVKDNVLFTLKSMGDDKKYLFLAAIVLTLSMICNLGIPFFTAKLIVYYTNNNFIQLSAVAVSILVVKLIYSIVQSMGNIFYNKVFFGIRANLETDLSEKILSVKDEIFEEKGTGPFISRITDDLTFISKGLTTIVDRFTRCMYFIGALIATLLLDVRIFVCEIITIVLLSIVEYFRSANLDVDGRYVYEAEEKRSGLLTDIINGEVDVKLLNGISFFRDKMQNISFEAKRRNNYKVFKNRIAVTIGECVTALCYFGISLLLGYYLHIGKNDVAKTLVLFNYFTIIGSPFILLIQEFVEFIRNYNLSCERIRNLQNGSEFPKEVYGNVCLEKIRGEIIFEHVSFAYNHENVLENDENIIQDFNIKINPGETIALIGKSGSGKSTLLKLISKQRICSSGQILIDGVNIQALDKNSLRNNIAVVNQFPYFFNASVKDNLIIAKPNATNEEIEHACEIAHIREDIEKLDNGYDTILGERGTRMSGGQKQRLAIARGILKGAKIILFDEATSAIDNITQSKIKKSIDDLHKNHTIVIVAHRLSTITNADRIILIEGGKIVAQGKHEQLIKESKNYKELYSSEV